MAFNFSLGFAEDYFCIDGNAALHLVAKSEDAASDITLYRFSITLTSTNGVYSQSFSADMPQGETELSIPFVPPLEWADDFAVNLGDLAHEDACGNFNAVMTVDYTGYAGTKVFTHTFTGYTARLSATVNADLLPAVGALEVTAVDGKVPAEWGLWVQGISTARVSCPQAAGIAGSSIVAYYFGDSGAAQSERYADFRLNESGSVTIPVTVEDSRLRRATADLLLTVQPYTAPALTGISSRRSDETGTEAEEGSCFFAQCTPAGSVLGGKNPLTVTCAWKAVTETAYGTPVDLIVPEDGPLLAAGLQPGTSYDVRYTISDAFYTVDYYDYLSSAAFLLHFLKGGTGIAVGKAAEQPSLFDVALNTTLRRDVTVGKNLAVAGSFVLAGVDVGAALQALGTQTSAAFALESSMADDAQENRIIRCGRLVLYRLQLNLTALTLAGTDYHLATVPAGYYSTDGLTVLYAIQNNTYCRAWLDSSGRLYLCPNGDGRQTTEIYGIGIV